MKPTIILTYPFHKEVIRSELAPRAKVKLAKNRAELKTLLRKADGLITLLSDPVDAVLLQNAPQLKVVGNYAVGVNNIDRKACHERGIRVVNTPGVLTRATAELTLALLLAAARRVPEGEALCRSGKFRGWAPDLLLGLELKGRQAVVAGRGRIGRETGRLFRALGLKVEWITRKDTERQIERKLSRARILSLHFPLTPDTHHWLDKKRIGLLPADAIVLNTTRGPVIDERALIQALKKRKIFAAGLDVYEYEPEIPSELRKLPNVALLPHLGSATAESRKAMASLVVSGVLGILDGKAPLNEVQWKTENEQKRPSNHHRLRRDR